MNKGPRQRFSSALAVLAISVVCIIAIIPVLWGLVTSLKPTEQILTFPPQWIPWPISLDSFEKVLYQSNVLLYFRNSVIVTVASLVVSLSLAIHAAYGLSRFKFWGHSAILIGVLTTSMIPGVAILVPLYGLSVKTGLYDTFLGLILVYSAWNVPILIWLMKGFFDKVPIELEEAALVDGASRWRVFYQIVLPLSQPGLVSGAIMVVMFVWNDFVIGFALTISEERRPLSVGLYTYISNYGVEWGQLMAATVIALTPVLLVFLLLQRRLVEGLAAGAIKG